MLNLLLITYYLLLITYYLLLKEFVPEADGDCWTDYSSMWGLKILAIVSKYFEDFIS